MATYTVSQLKAKVASFPAGANAWRLEVPDGLMIPVHDSRSVDPDGTLRINIRGYINLATGDWTPA